MDLAPWLKSVHIIAFTAWMAGMWYLPRLLVYHADTERGTEQSETFKVMERRLLKVIATPAMLVTILLGVWLATMQGQWSDGWLHAKLAFVLLMGACHGLLVGHVRKFGNDERPWPARRYRILNEVPTVAFVVIVLLVILKPL